MNTSVRKTLRDFTGKKLRTAMLIVSIMVGVFAISGVGTMSATITQAFTDLFAQSNVPDITVVTTPLDASIVSSLGRLTNVTGAEARTTYQTRIEVGSTWHSADLVGMPSFTHVKVNRILLRAGTFPSGNGMVLEFSNQRALGLKVGDTIRLQGQHATSSIRVTGFATDPAVPPVNVAGVSEGFMTESNVRGISGIRGVNELLLTIKTFDKKDATVAAVRSVLRKDKAQVLAFTVRDPNHFQVLDTFKTLTLILTIFGIVAIVLSGMLVINTMNTVISEQIPHVGTMKAVGANTGQIIRSYLSLGLMYGAVGTVLGLVLGIVGAYGLVKGFAGTSGITVSGLVVSGASVGEGLAVGIGVTLLASLLPVLNGSKITVRQAITSYGIGTGYRPSRLDAVVGLLPLLSRPTRMSVRNTFRRRLRLVLTLIPLTLAGALFLAVSSLSVGLTKAVDQASTVNHADFVVQMQQPGKTSAVRDAARKVGGVHAVEAWYQTLVTLAGQDGVTLWGVPAGTTAYHFNPVSGAGAFRSSGPDSWLRHPRNGGIVVSAVFARDNNLKVGQTIAVKSPSGATVHWNIVGIVNDQNQNGSLAFAPRREVQTLMQAQGTTNYLLVTTARHTNAAVTTVTDTMANVLFGLGLQPRFTQVADLASQNKNQFIVFSVLFYVMVVLVAVVGALGLFAVLAMNVEERRKEIGVMRSIGASSAAVLRVFSVEGLTIGVIAFLLATIVGIPATAIFTAFITRTLIQVDFLVVPAYVILMLVLTLLVSAAASIFPALSAARLAIADVLRYG